MPANASKFLAIALAASFATGLSGPARAEPHFTPSEVSLVAGSFLVLLPFSLLVAGSEKVSQSLASLGDHSRWKVSGVKDQKDGRTETEMQCDDGKRKLTMTVPTRTAHEQRLAVGDQVDVDRVGKAGYVVKKGQAAIGVLADPGGGMVHSKARS
jgi:hypothetical protein